MKNHFHLVLETPEGNLVAGLRWLLGIYSNHVTYRESMLKQVLS
jgi:REP element-mobilizing transposase RayT